MRRPAWKESAAWRARPTALGAFALAFALHGQTLLTGSQGIAPATRWYAAAIVLMIAAWQGTYRNRSIVSLPASAFALVVDRERPAPAQRRWTRQIPAVRALLVLASVGVNLYSVKLLRSHDYTSSLGALGWLASLLLLVTGVLGQRQEGLPQEGESADPVAKGTDFRVRRALEIGIVLSILGLATALRLYRLGDWTTGVHGDEGEAGLDALRILEGNPVSPFQTGWAAQSNFYYWSLALTMKAFGTGLSGLRMFSALAGSLMVVPFYLLMRQWFGVRMAIIASVFLAISDVTIHFSRQEFTNITTPLFQVTGFFFLFRGLATGRLLHFALAGYAHMFSLYFYLGGRLTPILLAAFFVYLFLIMPLVRLPRAAVDLRARHPALRWPRAVLSAVKLEGRRARSLAMPLAVFFVASFCFVSPWLAYYVDHQQLWNVRAKEKIIFSQPDRMVAQHDVTHDPLYLGLRLPNPTDVLPLPVVFAKTPVSVRLAADGFWPTVIWKQLTTTLSILTYRFDASSFYTFTLEPIAKPIESALIVLGIAWALWRWRDTRMALLSLWFWLTVFVGGALTIDAPYMSRLIGIVPTMAAFAAIPLNKLAVEFVHIMDRGGSPVRRTVARAVSGAALLGLLAILTWQNFHDYYFRYLSRLPFAEGTGKAYFVRQMNRLAAGEGRPAPKYYELGAHFTYWGYGVNRFLNYGTPGLDMANVSNELPVFDNEDRDVVFMVWPLNAHYLPVIRKYYPDGVEAPFHYGPPGQSQYFFTSYRVKREQLDARRVLRATYRTARGSTIQRDEPSLGSSRQPPEPVYPVEVRWTGSLIAPRFGPYRFRLESPGAATLSLDGTTVASTAGGQAATREFVLARGPHEVRLAGRLPSEQARIDVKWSDGTTALRRVPRQYLWAGPGRGLEGEIRPLGNDPFGERPKPRGGRNSAAVVQRRIDGFLGFRDSPRALSGGSALMGTWTGNLTIADPGRYEFGVFSNGDSTISVDRTLVVDNRRLGTSPRERTGRLWLSAGTHRFRMQYTWSADVGYLETYWTPPGGKKTILGPSQLSAHGGVWPLRYTNVTGAKSLTIGETIEEDPGVLVADVILAASSQLAHPRGCTLDAQGNLYAVDTEHHRVALFDAGGRLIRSWGKEGRGPGEFTTAEDVAVDKDEKVYVLDSALARVQVFTPQGRLERTIPDVGCSPAGLAVGSDGSVFIADTCGNGIRRYGASGALLTVYRGGPDAATRLEQPVDVAVGRDGSLYVADLRNRIVKLDPSRDTIEKTWAAQIGRSFGAANLALAGNFLYLSNPDRNVVTAIDVGSGTGGIRGGASGSGAVGAPLCLPRTNGHG